MASAGVVFVHVVDEIALLDLVALAFAQLISNVLTMYQKDQRGTSSLIHVSVMY